MHRRGSAGFHLWRQAMNDGVRVWVRWWRVGNLLRPEIRP